MSHKSAGSDLNSKAPMANARNGATHPVQEGRYPSRFFGSYPKNYCTCRTPAATIGASFTLFEIASSKPSFPSRHAQIPDSKAFNPETGREYCLKSLQFSLNWYSHPSFHKAFLSLIHLDKRIFADKPANQYALQGSYQRHTLTGKHRHYKQFPSMLHAYKHWS